MEPIQILFAVLTLVISALGIALDYVGRRRQQAPTTESREPEEPRLPGGSPSDHHKRTNNGEQPEGSPATPPSGTQTQRWQRELVDVGIAAAATVAVAVLIRATPWGDCGACDDVLDFGRYTLADIVVVLVSIFVVRAILRFAASRERALLGVGGVLALLSVYGLMWLATVVWGGTLDPRTIQYDPRNAKFAVYVGGYSDFDPTLRAVVLASAIVALSNVSAWIRAQPSID